MTNAEKIAAIEEARRDAEAARDNAAACGCLSSTMASQIEQMIADCDRQIARLETLAAAQMAAAQEISEPTLAELAASLRARDAREAANPKAIRQHETLWDRQNYGQGDYHG